MKLIHNSPKENIFKHTKHCKLLLYKEKMFKHLHQYLPPISTNHYSFHVSNFIPFLRWANQELLRADLEALQGDQLGRGGVFEAATTLEPLVPVARRGVWWRGGCTFPLRHLCASHKQSIHMYRCLQKDPPHFLVGNLRLAD